MIPARALLITMTLIMASPTDLLDVGSGRQHARSRGAPSLSDESASDDDNDDDIHVHRPDGQLELHISKGSKLLSWIIRESSPTCMDIFRELGLRIQHPAKI